MDMASVHEASRLALDSGRLVFAHDRTIVLDREGTQRFLLSAGEVLEGEEHSNTFSGVVAVPRTMWDRVGGFDERFIGWGGEDMAFWSACCALGPSFERVPGTIVHLWHPREGADQNHDHYQANEDLMRRYLEARNSRSKMIKILAGPNGPLGKASA
jgi:predicted glycosyltransferase involved in capsule biosynthesis